MSPLVDEEEDKADIHTDASLERGVEADVARHGLPVAVEGQADELALTVEHRGATVAARNVVVREEAQMEVVGAAVSIAPPVTTLKQRDDVLFHTVVLDLALLRRLVQQALRGGVVVEVAALGRIVLDISIGETHGEVGIAVVGCILVHLHEGLRKQTLVVADDVVRLAHASADVHHHVGDALRVTQCRVAVAQRAVGEEAVKTIGTGADAPGEEVVGIRPTVAAKEAVNDAIAVGPIVAILHLLAIVLEQCGHRFLIDPCIIVLEEAGKLLAGGIGLCLAHVLRRAVEHAGHTVYLDTPHEGLTEEAIGMDCLAAGGVGRLEAVKDMTEAAVEVLASRVPLPDVLLQTLLLADDVEVGNRLVHTDGVLPIVAASGPLAGILDAHSAVLAHPAFPHLLLLAAHLDGRYVAVLHTLADTPRAEVAAGGAGIAHGHAEVAGLEAVDAHPSIALRA